MRIQDRSVVGNMEDAAGITDVTRLCDQIRASLECQTTGPELSLSATERQHMLEHQKPTPES